MSGIIAHSAEVRGTSYLGRLLDVVAAVAAAPAEGISASELAERTETPASTLSRLVRILDDRGLVRRLPTRRLAPGPALTTLGLRSLRSLAGDDYRAAVAELAQLTGESASVALLVGDEITLVARQESAHALRYVASVGDAIPPHRSAIGKAVLAHVDERRRRAILERAVGDAWEAVLAELADELEAVAREGFARDEEVFAVGLRCIAAPLRDGGGTAFGGVSVSGPTVRFTREVADGYVAPLLAHAQRIGHLRRGTA